jgi:hypothetical protein
MKIGFDAKRAFNNSTGLGNYAGAQVSFVNMMPAFQIGTGAKQHQAGFGGSGWLSPTLINQPDNSNYTIAPGSQFDINVEFSGSSCIACLNLPPTATISGNNNICSGQNTTLTATGGGNYAWSNGANTSSTTVTSSGWYKCTASNGACTAKDSVYVSLFNPKITQNDTTVCAGTPLTLTVNNNTALTSSLPANLRNGLVGYWPFNGNANDESGNGNNGTVNGAMLASDRLETSNKAYFFDGINDVITVTDNFNLRLLPDDFSISARSITTTSPTNSSTRVGVRVADTTVSFS